MGNLTLARIFLLMNSKCFTAILAFPYVVTCGLYLLAATDTRLRQKSGNFCLPRSQQQAGLAGTRTKRFLHRRNKTNERTHQKLSGVVGIKDLDEDEAWILHRLLRTHMLIRHIRNI